MCDNGIRLVPQFNVIKIYIFINWLLLLMMVASVSAEGNFQTDPEGAKDRGYFFGHFSVLFSKKQGIWISISRF